MKKLLPLIFFLLICAGANAQEFAVIKDKDGFVNIRQEKNNTSAIVGKLNQYDVFTCVPDNTDWWHIWYAQDFETNTPVYLEGFIHKSRITVLNHWITVDTKHLYTDSCVVNTHDLLVIINKQTFRTKNHKLQYNKAIPGENIGRTLQKINGKSFWGTDGTMPKEVISNVRIIKDKKLILIPKSAFDDLYQPNLKTLSVYFGPENTIYISMQNSDGAGAYTIFWIIKNNQFYKRHIDNSEA